MRIVLAATMSWMVLGFASAQAVDEEYDARQVITEKWRQVHDILGEEAVSNDVAEFDFIEGLTGSELQFALQQVQTLAEGLTATSGTVSAHAAAPIPASSTDPPCGSSVNGGVVPFGYAICVNPCVTIPSGAEILTVRMRSANAGSGSLMECSSGVDCPIGWAKWWNTPEVYENGTRVCGYFKNWSHTIDRQAVLEVVYTKR